MIELLGTLEQNIGIPPFHFYVYAEQGFYVHSQKEESKYANK